MDIIEDIRRDFELDKDVPSVLSECAEQALELLADQLYTTDTHFLLEFVQNAEDNEYHQTVDPTLCITIRDETMTLSCNEVGFSERNVRAICKVGGSTKKNISGFIGEKGIGFKSVFKVADVVYVASNCYSFKFDRSQRLGMIAPIWDGAAPSTPGWTTFHLELSKLRNGGKTPGAVLSTKLSDIKPSLLLFLKKLRSIELDVDVSGGHTLKKIKVEREDQGSGFIRLICIDNGEVQSEDMYMIVKYEVNMSGLHTSRRRGVESTELVLAFPIDEEYRPLISPRNVHAFLPLRKFGFNFVIHGDFLTSSSREDILHDSPWNLTIRDAIVDAFVAAVCGFRRHGTLRDTWIRYLPTRIVDSFFSPVEHAHLKRFKTMKVVKDSHGTYRRPCEVIYVPPSFRIRGEPLVSERFLPNLYYLSNGYDPSTDRPILERLGVREMTADDFLSGLSGMDTASLVACDIDWHEAVSSKLIRLRKQSRSLGNSVLNLKILPLNDGSWALARDASSCVFESTVDGIPHHLDFRRIHPSIHPSRFPRRYELFSALGVRDVDPVFVARKILEFRGRLLVQAHVSNAMFFFNHRFLERQLPSPSGRLLIVDELGKADIGEKLYMDLPVDKGKLRRCLPPSARFIHSEYFKRVPNGKHDNWLSWARDCLRLNTAPRVVNSKLSSEFRDMMKRSSLPELLKTLRYFWHRFPTYTPTFWQKELEEYLVTLQDGSQCALGSMYLKRKLLAKYHGIPFVPVNDPESKEWDFLSRIGVTIRVDPTFFVKLLIRYQSEAVEDEEAVRNIYKQLDARFDERAVGISTAFENHPLIFVSIEGSGSWRHLKNVYWDGPASMTSRVALRRTYPELGEFFQGKLGLGNAPPGIVIDELKLLINEWNDEPITDDVHKRISKMLVGLSALLEEKLLDTSTVIGLLEGHAIFPARLPSTMIRLCKLADIYVPDRTGYYASIFRDKVPLLELSGCRLSKISFLLGISGDRLVRRLEYSVNHQINASGTRELLDNLTATYAGAYCAFERIVHHYSKPDPSSKQLEMLSRIREISVYQVDSISSTISLDDLPPISTSAELLQVLEDERTVTVYISKSADDISRVNIEICERLSAMLGCNAMYLLTCIALDPANLEIFLQRQGIDVVDSQPTVDNSWLRSRINSSMLSITHKSMITPSRNGRVPEDSRGTAVSNIQSDAFSFEELHNEIDRLDIDLPNFSSSSFRAVFTNRSELRTPMEVPYIVSSRDSNMTVLNMHPSEVPNSSPVPSGLAAESTAGYQVLASRPTQLVLSQPFKFLLSQPPIVSPRPSRYQEANGFLGERYVYGLLSAVIGPTFGPENWTSELRGLDPRFSDYVGPSLADFTFEDSNGILTKELFKDDQDLLEEWMEARPTYHIEVKSTSSGSSEPFFLSKRQLFTALSLRQYMEYNNHKHIYVIIRVWSVRNPKPNSYKVYVDPIRCILGDKLKIVSENIQLMIGG